jgi:hypothetical protein
VYLWSQKVSEHKTSTKLAQN